MFGSVEKYRKLKGQLRALVQAFIWARSLVRGRGIKHNTNLGSILGFLNYRVVRKVMTLSSLTTIWSFFNNSRFFLSNENIIAFCQKVWVLLQSSLKVF